MIKKRIGRQVLPNGKTVAQQRFADELATQPKVKLVGEMSNEEFEDFAKKNPNHPMVIIRRKKES